LFIDVN